MNKKITLMGMNQNELEDYCLSNDFQNFMANKYLDGSIKIIIKS